MIFRATYTEYTLSVGMNEVSIDEQIVESTAGSSFGNVSTKFWILYST